MGRFESLWPKTEEEREEYRRVRKEVHLRAEGEALAYACRRRFEILRAQADRDIKRYLEDNGLIVDPSETSAACEDCDLDNFVVTR